MIREAHIGRAIVRIIEIVLLGVLSGVKLWWTIEAHFVYVLSLHFKHLLVSYRPLGY